MEAPGETDLVSSAGSSFIMELRQLSPWHGALGAGARRPAGLGGGGAVAAGSPWLCGVTGCHSIPTEPRQPLSLLIPGNAVWDRSI